MFLICDLYIPLQADGQAPGLTEIETISSSVGAEDGGTGMQVEIPFIPLAQRQTTSATAVVDDSIVVVGQARQQRKRKRERNKAADEPKKHGVNGKTREEMDVEGEGEGEPEVFDFSSVPNILDDVPDSENTAKRAKRKKKEKGGGKGRGWFFLCVWVVVRLC